MLGDEDQSPSFFIKYPNLAISDSHAFVQVQLAENCSASSY